MNDSPNFPAAAATLNYQYMWKHYRMCSHKFIVSVDSVKFYLMRKQQNWYSMFDLLTKLLVNDPDQKFMQPYHTNAM